MNARNYTNFESKLAMIMIYVPFKFEFDWTNRFRVESGNENVDRRMDKRTKKRTNERTELHQFQKEPSYDGDLSPCQV